MSWIHWDFWQDGFGLLIIDGLWVTLELSAAAWCLALVLGAVFGVIRWFGWRITRPVCWLYVEAARNTPPIVQILFWYFSASYIFPNWLLTEFRAVGLNLTAAIIALGVYQGAFFAEIFRAGLNAIDRGQYEAARVLGLRFLSTLSCVILPQMAAQVIPPMVNETTSLIKNTSLAVAIGVTELTYQYRYIDAYAFRGVEALLAITVLYMLLCFAVAACGSFVSLMVSRHYGPSGSSVNR